MKTTTSHGKKILQRQLLAWYQKKKRPLPWRNTKDPYKIWVSEIMLQQTQVATVIPYYKRWLKAFPTVQALARAPLTKALKLWEGLGYYRRTRMLHRAARYIMKGLGGEVPNTADGLQRLPGVGRYSAGAIASIAFEEKVPVLDGNVIRVLTRLFAIKKCISLSSTINALWQIAEELLPERSIGDFNQSMMELGATLCFPQNPDCHECPVRELCAAHKCGEEIMFPVKTRKENYENLAMYALASQNGTKEVFIQKQPPGHWWAGLWTFPFWNTRAQLLEAADHSKNLVSLGRIHHGVTRFKITLHVFRKISKTKHSLGLKGRWVRVADLGKLALPSPHRKIANLLINVE